MVSQLFVQLCSCPRIKCFRMQAEGGFGLDQNGRRVLWKLKVQLPAFEEALRRRNNKNFVFEDWPASLCARIVPQLEGDVTGQDEGGVGGVELVVSMEKGTTAV